jgi:hypothetical protein
MALRIPAAVAAVFATLVPAAAAQAGTVTLDHPCYVESGAMVVTGTGFKPNSQLTLSGDGASQNATADASGNFQAPVQVPLNPSSDAKPASIVTYTLNVQDAADATQNTSAKYQVTNFAVDRGQSASPRSRRTWRFAGFEPGIPIYAHFLYKGKAQANYRMGVPKGPCGTLSRKAPGIIASRLRTGTWTIQVDQSKTYNKTRVPAVVFRTVLYISRR